jgi:sulfite reductase (ferredoxin)
MEQGDGRLAYGVFVQNGRLKGELKAALRRVIERYELPVIITANQNIILTEIHPSWKADILDTLSGAGVRWRSMLLWCFTYLWST